MLSASKGTYVCILLCVYSTKLSRRLLSITLYCQSVIKSWDLSATGVLLGNCGHIVGPPHDLDVGTSGNSAERRSKIRTPWHDLHIQSQFSF